MNDDIPLPPHGKSSVLENRAPCRWCGDSTLVSMLNHYGARCFACYEAYCGEPLPKVDAGDKRTHGPKAWAHALRAREERGEPLSPAQRAMWRSAISSHDVLDRVKDGDNVPEPQITRALQLTGDIPWPDRHDVPAFDEVDP